MTSHIRIPDVSPVVQAVADGAKSVFSFPFPIFKASDLEVRSNSSLVTSDYSVVGEGSSTGGAVIFTNAPMAGARITLRRKQTYARTDDFLDERAPTPHELNDAVDQSVAAIQELAEQVSRAVTRPLSADLSQPVDLSLPTPEAGKVIGWNGSANALVNLVQVDVSDMLHKSQNLADLPDKPQARINLGLGSAATHGEGDFATAAQGAKADTALQSSIIDTDVALSANSDGKIASQKAVKAYVDSSVAAGDGADLKKAQNLADLNNVATARSNLGLGTAATHGEGDFATAAQGAKADTALQSSIIDTDVALSANSDGKIASQKAVKAYVDSSVAAGDAADLKKAQNLADLNNVATARSNLGLGTAATKNVGTASTDVAAGNHTHAGVYEPLDSSILRTPDIGNTVQGYDANIVKKNVANTYTAPQTPSSQTLTDASTVSIAITNQVWLLTTSASRTIGAPTGGVANTFYFLKIVTNGYTPIWDTAFDFGTAGIPANLTGTCGFDIFYDGSKYRISTRFTGGV